MTKRPRQNDISNLLNPEEIPREVKIPRYSNLIDLTDSGSLDESPHDRLPLASAKSRNIHSLPPQLPHLPMVQTLELPTSSQGFHLSGCEQEKIPQANLARQIRLHPKFPEIIKKIIEIRRLPTTKNRRMTQKKPEFNKFQTSGTTIDKEELDNLMLALNSSIVLYIANLDPKISQRACSRKRESDSLTARKGDEKVSEPKFNDKITKRFREGSKRSRHLSKQTVADHGNELYSTAKQVSYRNCSYSLV